MCLVVVAFQVSEDFPLIVAANRDEFHSRRSAAAHWWPDAPGVLAGRDLEAGGTWLGVHRSGRFAAVTNFRDAEPPSGRFESRGRLVAEFLSAAVAPVDYVASIDREAYAGFNLLVSDGSTLAYLSNRGGGLQSVAPGIYGLSNATLDAPWEKVERSKARLARLIDERDLGDDALQALLADRSKGPVEEVRDQRLPFATAHAFTAPFIVTTEYGTRCSSTVFRDRIGRWQFVERRFDASGQPDGESRFSFGVDENRE
jgi:uncharacterized protein with NRDE domain